TGRAALTVESSSRSTSIVTAPSAPADGSFASRMSAPPANAATASAAFLALTSSRIGGSCIIRRVADSTSQALAGPGVLVTGASSGIGRAIALAAARSGADVAITYRVNESGARDVEREIARLGRRSFVSQLDLAEDRSIHALGSVARRAF